MKARHKYAYAYKLPRPTAALRRLLGIYEASNQAHEEAERVLFEADLALLDAIEEGWTEAEIQAAQRASWGVDDAPPKTTRKKKTTAKKTAARKSRRKPRCEACNSTDLAPYDLDPSLFECGRCGRIGGAS